MENDAERCPACDLEDDECLCDASAVDLRQALRERDEWRALAASWEKSAKQTHGSNAFNEHQHRKLETERDALREALADAIMAAEYEAVPGVIEVWVLKARELLKRTP